MKNQGEQPQANAQSKATAESAPQKNAEQRANDAAMRVMGLSPDPVEETTLDGEPTVEDVAEQASEADGEQSDTEQADSQDDQQASGLEEVEYEGKKFNVPREIKDALLRQSDYTRKTQEVAEARRAVAEQQKLMQAQIEFQSTIVDDIGQLKAIDGQLSQFNNINWSQLDTDAMVRTKHQLDMLKEARSQVASTIQRKHSDFMNKRQQAIEQMSRAGLNLLQQKISGFNQESSKDLTAYMAKEGYTDPEISSILDPRHLALAWKAMQYDKLQASKPNIQNRAKGAPPVVKPGASQKPVAQGDFLKNKFANAKSPAEKKLWGQELLAKKLGV